MNPKPGMGKGGSWSGRSGDERGGEVTMMRPGKCRRAPTDGGANESRFDLLHELMPRLRWDQLKKRKGIGG